MAHPGEFTVHPARSLSHLELEEFKAFSDLMSGGQKGLVGLFPGSAVRLNSAVAVFATPIGATTLSKGFDIEPRFQEFFVPGGPKGSKVAGSFQFPLIAELFKGSESGDVGDLLPGLSGVPADFPFVVQSGSVFKTEDFVKAHGPISELVVPGSAGPSGIDRTVGDVFRSERRILSGEADPEVNFRRRFGSGRRQTSSILNAGLGQPNILGGA